MALNSSVVLWIWDSIVAMFVEKFEFIAILNSNSNLGGAIELSLTVWRLSNREISTDSG